LASSIRLEIVTPESVIYSDEVDAVVAPGIEGQLGILPHHAPLITMLQTGELRVRKGDEETCMAIYGGFLEVRPDRVIILADAAERAEEIDIARAEEAKRRAEQQMASRVLSEVDRAQAEAALRHSLVQLKVGERKRKRKTGPA
jgi:F-type H+-transporting ATPase subunit epsilon